MNRIKLKNNRFKFITIILIGIFFICLYLITINNSYIKLYIKNDIFNKFNNKGFSINKDRIIYNSLNKIISYSDISNIKNNNVMKIVNKEEVNEIKEEQDNETKKGKKIVYIYNTHDTEKYSSIVTSDFSLTPDVKLASYILKDYLNDYGIETDIQTKSISSYLKKHNLNYYGCYDASRAYAKEMMKKNDYKILIDLHRDSVKHKYTLYKKDKVNYSKLMFVLATKHKNYKQNEKFVKNINNRINKKFKGLSRGIMIRKDEKFNQDLSNNAILIELGGVDNTLEEINNTLKVLAQVLSEYIKEEL